MTSRRRTTAQSSPNSRTLRSDRSVPHGSRRRLVDDRHRAERVKVCPSPELQLPAHTRWCVSHDLHHRGTICRDRYDLSPPPRKVQAKPYEFRKRLAATSISGPRDGLSLDHHREVALTHVCYRGKSRKHLLVASFSYFDPKRTFRLNHLNKGAIKWTRLLCRSFAANAVRLQLHALAYNLGNFLRTLATPEPIEDWSLTSLKEKLIKIGAKVVSQGRYVTFQMAEVAVPKNLFADILRMIAELRPPPDPAPA